MALNVSPSLVRAIGALAALAGLSFASHAQTGGYPSRVVRIIVPTAPGGAGDTIARLVAQGLTERLGRQVLVEARPGAGTMIGTELVVKSPPDGHTLLLGLSTLAINPATYRKMPYDALRDLTPITQLVVMPNAVCVHPSVPARSVKDFIALAKARPGEILYGSSGHGTNPHLTMELLAGMAGMRMTHVPYKSSIPGMTDLIAGHIAVMSLPMLHAIPQVRGGRLRALGITSASRTAAAPDIPTIAESGLPGFESVQWYGMLVPARTSQEIVDRLYKEVSAIVGTNEARERFAGDGAERVVSSPEQFAAFLRAETTKWAAVAKTAGIVPE
jgi:tripartite-type tricarboxylate transporter receptor subunit TctC